MKEMEIWRAGEADVERVMGILAGARQYQRDIGFRQWADGYPSRSLIEADVESGRAYVLVDEGVTVGYALLAVGDEAYDALGDIWTYEGPFGVVHRLAMDSSVRGRGLAARFLSLIEAEYKKQGINIVRIDTGRENVVMQRLMDRCGYEPRGYHEFVWGGRLAYEKHL